MSQIDHADFTPSAPNFKHLVFMNMQQLTNFPYIEKDFDALTDYALLCKVVDYLNEVIANNNEQNSLMVALRDAYIDLQNYVNNYFDNLDVQEEINNKLEDMAQSGELTTLIKAYVDPIYQAYEDEINGEISYQNTRIGNIEAKVDSLSSGAPIPVSNISGMTDTTKVYVLTTDGYWYYYDGDSWERGGVYQSTGLGENEVKYKNLSLNLQNIFSTNLDDVDVESGHYIRYDGFYSSSNNFSVTDPILLKKGETIYCKSAVTENMAVFSEKIEDKYYPLTLGIEAPGSSVIHEYFYTATKDMYVAITFRHNLDYTYYKFVSSNELVKLENIKEYTPSFIVDEGHYINSSGTYSSSTPYYLSSPILLKPNEKISINGLAPDIVSIIAQKNGDGSYTSLVVGESLTEVKTYEYTNNNLYDIYVVLSYYNIYPALVIKTLTQNIFTDIYENINKKDNINNQKNNPLYQFNNITAIGDSLTYCQVYTSSNTSRQSYKPWAKVLSKIIGSDYEILSSNGATASSWWASFNEQLTNTNKDNLFIIYLGTNYGLTDTLSTDAPVNTDYNTWANTNTGCYAKIVAKCQDLGGKVLLLTPWITAGGASLADTIKVIKQVAERFNVPYLDAINLSISQYPNYHYWPNKQGSNSVHMNDLGYAVFAQKVLEEVGNFTDSQVYNMIMQ